MSPDPIKSAAEISDHISFNTLADSEGGNDCSHYRDEVSHVSASEDDESLQRLGVIPDNYERTPEPELPHCLRVVYLSQFSLSREMQGWSTC